MSSKTSYNNSFAYYYNQLIDESFYDDLIMRISKLGNFNNILDLACGSGTFAFKLKNDDNNVTGIDLSNEMLMIAQYQNKETKKGIVFIESDLNEMVIGNNNYDLITCTLDSLNYIKGIKNIEIIFTKVFNALSKGYFIFDILSQHYIDKIVNDYYQCEEVNNFEYVWEVKKIEDNIIKHDLRIACEEENFHEEHLQYIFDVKIIKELLYAVGFDEVEIIEEYNELNNELPSRFYFITRKD